MTRKITPEQWPGKQVEMFAEGGKQRNGFFSCQAKDPKTHVVTKVVTVKIGKFYKRLYALKTLQN